jgi:serine phosphatase RsbU (regulator of sigma subunit)
MNARANGDVTSDVEVEIWTRAGLSLEPLARADSTPQVDRLLDELTRRQAENQHLWHVIEQINRGSGIEEILDFIFVEFRGLVPYDRISYAVVEQETGLVVAKWARSEGGRMSIVAGYSRPLAKSGLAEVCRSGQSRVINDLAVYLRERPESDSTRKLLDEGMRSSLTCPLVVGGQPVGFLFFDSRSPGAYSNGHLDLFQQVAGVVSGLIERGRMYSELAANKVVIEEQIRQRDEEYHRGQQDLELARKVQRALIPASLPVCEHLSLAMLYEPAEKVGGDLLDCVRLSDETSLVYVADAMGHGVPAALLMTVVRTAFHGALARQPRGTKPSPAILLGEVNRTLVELLGRNYVTAVCVRIDSREESLTLSLAGHPPALIRRGFATDVAGIAAQSIPLGISGDTTYSDVVVAFEPGDTLVLYTDGVTEAAAPDGTFLGIAGLKQALRGWKGGSVDGLIERLRRHVDRFTGRTALDDDLTILAVQATPYS